MNRRFIGFALLWLASMCSLRAAIADAWIDALAITRVQPDERLFGHEATLGTIFAATLAAVQAQHPELPPLRIAGSPKELETERLRWMVHVPKRDILAAEVLLVLAGAEIRIDITDDQLLLVRVDPGAEQWRARQQGGRENLTMMEAVIDGKADQAMLARASHRLRRAGVVATYPAFGSYYESELAFMLLLKSRDAQTRFETIEPGATPAGRFYARAGLLALGWSSNDLARLGPLSGEIMMMSGDVGGSTNAQLSFENWVANGKFVEEIRNVTPTKMTLEAARKQLDRAANFERPAAALSPSVVGRVLRDEVELFITPSDWWISPAK